MSDAIREALQTLRDNIRDEKGSVQRLGIRDNDNTREAISVLLANEASLGANGGEAGDEYDALRDFGNWMEWSAGQPGNTESFADFCRNAAGHARSFARMREEARDIYGNPVYPKSMGSKRPAPPSVAVPEAVTDSMVMRGAEWLHDHGLSIDGDPASATDQMQEIAEGLFSAMLAAAPAHIADAGKVVAELDRIRGLIAQAPIDSLGTGHNDGSCPPWPIRDEIVDGLSKIIRALPSTPSVPEEEVKAKALEEFAAHMGDCIALWRMAKEEGLRGTIRASEEWANKMKRNAARLRASQQEGGEG